MRVSITKSKNFEFVYIIKDFYNNKSRTTKIYEKLGTMDSLCKEKNMSRDEVISWAKSYARQLTAKEKMIIAILLPFSPDSIIERDVERKFNCGYLFLQNIYYNLRLDNIYCNIKNKYKFDYALFKSYLSPHFMSFK